MTIQEKFENAAIIYDADLNFVKNYEQIADNYALGFEEFKEKYNNSHRIHKQGRELLEIYKKTL